ncbi:hypothetical protein [Neobacillus sp. NPDC093127]
MTQVQFNLNMDVLNEAIANFNLDMVIRSAVVLVLNEFMEKERDDYL